MKIGLISDSHLEASSEPLITQLNGLFNDVDLILHAGDIISQDFICDLEKIAPVIAIQGNVDRMAGLDLPKTKVIEKEGIKIGLIHGEIYPRDDSSQLYYIAKELDVNILVSGHSHQPKIEEYEDVLLVNPGSPTTPRLAEPSVMTLEINEGNVEIKLLKLGPSVCKALDFDKFKK